MSGPCSGRVDAGNDDVGRVAEGPEAADDHDEGRRPVDGMGGNVRHRVELDGCDLDAVGPAHGTDGGAGPAVVGRRRGDGDVVAQAGHGRGQRREAGSSDAVIVGDEDPKPRPGKAQEASSC